MQPNKNSFFFFFLPELCIWRNVVCAILGCWQKTYYEKIHKSKYWCLLGLALLFFLFFFYIIFFLYDFPRHLAEMISEHTSKVVAAALFIIEAPLAPLCSSSFQLFPIRKPFDVRFNFEGGDCAIVLGWSCWTQWLHKQTHFFVFWKLCYSNIWICISSPSTQSTLFEQNETDGDNSIQSNLTNKTQTRRENPNYKKS